MALQMSRFSTIKKSNSILILHAGYDGPNEGLRWTNAESIGPAMIVIMWIGFFSSDHDHVNKNHQEEIEDNGNGNLSNLDHVI